MQYVMSSYCSDKNYSKVAHFLAYPKSVQSSCIAISQQAVHRRQHQGIIEEHGTIERYVVSSSISTAVESRELRTQVLPGSEQGGYLEQVGLPKRILSIARVELHDALNCVVRLDVQW
jgi:hypothetical protein